MPLDSTERAHHTQVLRDIVAKADAMDDPNSPGGKKVQVGEVVDLLVDGVIAVTALVKDFKD